MEEKVFFDKGSVSVSNSRFIVHGQTYAMNGVTSVKQAINNPPRFWPIVVGFIGLIIILGGTAGSIISGGIIFGLAIYWWTQQKPDWIVVLSSSSGETRALSSKDHAFINGVIQALNDSIIHRG